MHGKGTRRWPNGESYLFGRLCECRQYALVVAHCRKPV